MSRCSAAGVRASIPRAHWSEASAPWSRRWRCARSASAAIPRSRWNCTGFPSGSGWDRAASCRCRSPPRCTAKRSWSRWRARPAPRISSGITAASRCAPAFPNASPPASRRQEAALYARLEPGPRPLEDLIASSAQRQALARLVARGLAQVVGFTPSDAAHVLGRQSNWNAEGARLGAELFRRQKNGRGQPVAASGEDLASRVLATLTRLSAEAILETAFAEDGLDGAAMVAHRLAQRAIEGVGGVARIRVTLDRPVIGLGASAALHYAALPALVGAECLTPPDADVANALGAVVGQVRVRAEATVTQPTEGRFRVTCGVGAPRLFERERGVGACRKPGARGSGATRRAAGTDEAEITVERDLRVADIEGRRMFIDATVAATAIGRPRIADESEKLATR